MQRFIALHFLPGAAGNFLSRCINLLDDTYVWASNNKVPSTLEEKLELLTYKNAANSALWTDFENLIVSYYRVQSHWNIGPNSNALFVMHPKSVNDIKKLTGKDATSINIYINSKNNLDWCILNGWHKHSVQSIEWWLNSESLAEDPSVYMINLSDIINGYEKFLPEFTKLAAYLDRTITNDIEIALHTLYNEWLVTIFQGPDFENQRNIAANFFRKIVNDFERNNQ